MIRRPPRSTLDRSSAASDVYKRQVQIIDSGARLLVERELAMIKLYLDRLRLADASDQSYRNNVRGLAAVSYTHLRAHETVLDLVCRLLLDKKKTKKKQH